MRRLIGLLPLLLLAGVPMPASAMIESMRVSNMSSNCAWVTPYRLAAFGTPRWIKPGESHTFNVDNSIIHKGSGDARGGSGFPIVRYGAFQVRAEFTGLGANCTQTVHKNLVTPVMHDADIATARHLWFDLRGGPHYHIEKVKG